MKRFGMRTLSVLLAAVLLAGLLYLPACAAEPCETMLEGMTTEEKISQMLMPSFRYWGEDEAGRKLPLEELPPEVGTILEKRGFAGVILFAQNAGETAKTVRLVDAMQTANASAEGRSQLLMAVDQEGGIVARLGQGTQTPGNMALGAVGDVTATKEMATVIGQELGAIGFNLNFAPVVDVNNNPANPVIGVRSFSDDPQTVAAQGVAYMEALRETGIISTLKHFPGHGDTGTDSHTGLPSIDKSYEELKQTELVPFQACIDAGVEAVMTAHIQYPRIETETYTSIETGEKITLPATLSETIMTDILRGDLGFEGVIVTDALNMDAIGKHFSPLDTARLAIEAGVDILLMPVDTSTAEGIDALDRYITDVAKLADEGKISMEKVDAAVQRILHLKEKKGLLTPYESGDLEAKVAQAVSQVGSKANHDREWEITKKAVTLVKNENNILPLKKNNQKIAVLTAYDNEVLGMEYAVGLLKDANRLPQGTTVTVTSIQKLDFDAVKPLIADADHVILVSEVGSAAALDPANDKGAYSAKADQIIDQVHRNGKTVTVLSASLPYDTARYQKADVLLIAWSAKAMSEDPRVTDGAVKQYGPNMPAALYLALSPDESPAGKLPVNIPALDDSYQYTDTVLYARGFGLTYRANGKPEPYHGGGGHSGGSGGGQAAEPEQQLAGQTEQQPEETAPAGVCARDVSCPVAAFSDASPAEWYHDGVHWALENGVMNGVSGTRFDPNGTATRAMVVTMLWRLEGEPEGGGSPFADVPADAWYGRAVGWAAEQAVVTGVSETAFSPDTPVTREQLATVLYRYAQARGMDVSVGEDTNILSYDDAFSISDWAMPAMQWACGAGILNGMGDGTLAPQSSASRAQIATMLLRFQEN